MKLLLVLVMALATTWVGLADDAELRAGLPAFCTDATSFTMDQVCNKVQLTSSPAGCAALTILGNIATATQPPKCRSAPSSLAAPPYQDRDGTLLPQDTPDVRSELTGSLPANLPTAAYMEAEGGTYFWYYRQLLNLANYTPCGPEVTLPLPRGWDLVETFETPFAPNLPFGVLLKPDHSFCPERRDSCRRWCAKAAADLQAASADETAEAQAKKKPAHRHPNYNSHGHKQQGDDYNTRDRKQHPNKYDTAYNRPYDGLGDYNRQYDGPGYNNRPYDDPSRTPEYEQYEQDSEYSGGGYSWGRRRYSEHYSCGRDDAEGTSPHLVLLLRGTLTLSEWAQKVSDPAYGPGKFSAGFYAVADGLWNAGLGAAVETEIVRGCRSITVAGHSLGGAVAQLLAVRIEGLFSEAYRYAGEAAPVTAVTFGSPAVGNTEWARNFDAKINARKLAFKGDLVVQTPCVPRIVGCPSPPAPIATNQTDFWEYAPTGGNIVFAGSHMPLVPLAWSTLEFVSGSQLCNTTLTVPAYSTGHICGYLCATSGYVDVSNNLCWIVPDVPAPPGSSRCVVSFGA